MNRILFLFVCLLAFVGAACAAPIPSPSPAPRVFVQPTLTVAVPVVSAAFDAARAFEHNRKLAVDIGKRVAGTQGGQSAADYIAAEFQKSGLQVTRQEFSFDGWEDRGTTVELLAPEIAKLDAQPIQYSPGGKLEGEIVHVPGSGSRDNFSKVNVRGKIALVKRGTLPFADKALNAQEAGARAILIYNDKPPSFTGTLRERVLIPTIGISGATGERLLKWLDTGMVRARIESDAGIVQRTGQNVIGTLRGKSDETIVIGGHYDTVPAGPGAGDNGSGTATVLELARAVGARPRPQHTLVFVAFDAEELGLIGSRAYVDDLSNEQLSKIRAMLNFDMLGGGSGPLILMGDGNTALFARASAQQLGIDARNAQMPANAGSDHESFARRGVDTVFFMRNYDLLHTPDDTIDQIKIEYLAEAGRVAERLIERLDATLLRKDSSSLNATP